VSTKSGTRYKTSAEVENKQLRRALGNIRTALFKMSEAVRQECEGSMAEVVVNNYVGAIQRTIDSLT
jgi:hypothetical protein